MRTSDGLFSKAEKENELCGSVKTSRTVNRTFSWDETNVFNDVSSILSSLRSSPSAAADRRGVGRKRSRDARADMVEVYYKGYLYTQMLTVPSNA